MAELDVQPKKKNPFIWIILILVLLALLLLFIRGCNTSDQKNNTLPGDTSGIVAATVTNWDSINFDVPDASYDEVTDKAIQVRGNSKYSIYTLGENVLFATDQSAIQTNGETQLKQISASLKKRYSGASIAIYGNTDSTGTASHNKELGAERAAAVKNWLVKQAGIAADKITIHSKGQSDPVASNETADGRQLNRSVQIVAMAVSK